MNALETFTTTELKAEIDRRASAEAAETTRQLNRVFNRNRLNCAVIAAREDVGTAEAEHLKRRLAADERAQLGLHVPPEQLLHDEVAVRQAARLIADSQLRLVDAEARLAAFDRDAA